MQYIEARPQRSFNTCSRRKENRPAPQISMILRDAFMRCIPDRTDDYFHWVAGIDSGGGRPAYAHERK
jgi:hypothetical protein